MGTDRKRLLNDFATFVALLRGEARTDSNHLMTSSFSLIFKDIEKRAPTGVHDALGQVMVFHHGGDRKVFHCDTAIAFGILLGYLEMMIAALPVDFEMRLRHIASGFFTAVTALLAAAQGTLFASQGALGGAIETWVFHCVALAIGKEDLQPNINADIRMLACRGKMRRLRCGFTHDEGIPMPIGPQDQMNSLMRKFYRNPLELPNEGCAPYGGGISPP